MKKLKVTVFVPLSACACSYSHFMNKVMEIILPFRSQIEFDVLNIDSPEADKYKLFQIAVVLQKESEKPVVVKSIKDLENDLKSMILGPDQHD
jgi:hypothetical protein